MGGGVPEIIARLLESRGISADGVDEFLSPSLRDLAPPCELPNVDAAAEAIRRYKFQGCSSYADAFGTLVAERIYEELYGRYDLITWVPVSRARLRKRGYDQAKLLAQYAARRLRQTAVPVLQKKPRVPQQSLTRSAEDRRANILGAYAVPKPEQIAGKRVLLIDDIITTGATSSECARMLRLAGASDVVCAALAKTPKKSANHAE